MINNIGGKNFYFICVKIDINGSGNNYKVLNFRKDLYETKEFIWTLYVRLINMMDLFRCIICNL